MAISSQTSFLLGLGVILLFIATPVAAFGAGDIVDVSSINDVNYRHGDIESILAELIIRAGSNDKFSKLDIKRVYFGNWLRDYSQAIDVGGLKQLPGETIRILLWCLSFITFGYATDEFEVTAERLGCYRPEEHIDNPKDYADNEDARKYDPRLRGPVDEARELAIDPTTGIKVYITSENAGVETSAGLVRKLFTRCIELGRQHHKDGNAKNEYHEALRLLGTGLHCLEDFSAHSNYTELALKELGVDAFPHVGKNTAIDVNGKKIFPLVTGTFGMTDFLHSVVGEVGDKVAQSQIEDMESKLDSAVTEDQNDDKKSVLKAILDKIPWDMLGGDGSAKPDPAQADALRDAANKKAEEEKNNPKDPNASLGGVNIEQAKAQAQQTLKDMYPILEFHDKVMKAVSKITSKVPGLDELTESLMGALQIFIFSLLAPYVKPIIAQARVELKSSSEGVLKTSMKGQYEVFENDNCTDPTHSMLSKDHFSNVLNPVAGQIAVATVKFVVPRIVGAWADDSKDIRLVIDDIIQVFHHPAHRDENREGQKVMYETVKTWWEGKSEQDKTHLKEILSTEGVKDGKNHEGESTDPHGHSHGAPPPKKNSEAQQGASMLSNLTGGLTNLVLGKTGLDQKFGKVNTGDQGKQEQHSTSGRQEETSSYGQSSYGNQQEQNTSSYGQTSSHGRNDDQETSYGGNTSSYGRQNEQSSYGHSSSGRNDNETSSYGGGNKYSSRKDEEPSNTYGSSRRDDTETSSYGGGHSGRRTDDDSSNTYGSSRRDDNETSSYGGGNTYSSNRNDEDSSNTYGSSRRDDNETSSYGGGNSHSSRRNDEDETNSYSRRNDNETSSYGQQTSSYGRNDNTSSSYGGGTSHSRRDDNETSSYGQQTSTYGGRNDNETSGYGSSRRDDNEESTGYGGRRHGGNNEESEESSYGQKRQTGGYGQEESEGYGRRNY